MKPQKLPPQRRVRRDEIAAIAERPAFRGRGAVTNPAGRFESEVRSDVDDGWDKTEDATVQIDTTLTPERAKSVISYNRSPDIHFDRSINPYRGCEHGCVYCFARPSHNYQGLSSGLDFESKLFFKPNAPELLARELGRPSYQPRVIALGVNTDAYQPAEREQKLTRRLLEVLAAFNHPVSLLTKSALIQRDIDIIAPMAAKGLCRVGVSITTLDRKLARLMEPRAATPARRLETVRVLVEAGVPVNVMTAPIIPALNDHEIEPLLQTSAEAGATRAGYVLLRLPHDLKDLFHEWLAAHFPDRAARIINHLREMRGGADYDARWFERGRGQGAYAKLIAQRFDRARRQYGLTRDYPPLRTDLFAPPPRPGDQMVLAL